MKPTRALLGLLGCCLLLLACQSAAWVLVSLTERVAVRLPVQPQRHLPAKPEQFIQVADSSGDYGILFAALPPAYSAHQRHELQETLVQVALQNEKEHLRAPTPFQLGNYQGVEWAGLMAHTEEQGLYYTASRLIIVEDTYYTFIFSCPANRPKREAAGKAFLESITLQASAK